MAVLGLLLTSSATVPAFAFDDTSSLFGNDEVPMVLTPARLRQPQSQVPASVTVIDRELIEASGAREIYQLLQLVPGMSAVRLTAMFPLSAITAPRREMFVVCW